MNLPSVAEEWHPNATETVKNLIVRHLNPQPEPRAAQRSRESPATLFRTRLGLRRRSAEDTEKSNAAREPNPVTEIHAPLLSTPRLFQLFHRIAQLAEF